MALSGLTGWLAAGGSAQVFPTMTPTATATPIPGIGSKIIREQDGMNMLYVPAGEFQMGSQQGGSNEQPVHNVYLDAYWMDETEVTNSKFAAFLNAEGNQNEGEMSWLSERSENVLIVQSNGSWQPKAGYRDHPVVEVTWYGASAYCSWVGARLPTEAEWEKAARGTDGRVYPWAGDFQCSMANGDDETMLDESVVPGGPDCDGYLRTAPVGTYEPGKSPYGVYDMAGNVWEWGADWYENNAYAFLSGNNPQGPASGQLRVLRGGAWVSTNDNLRSTARFGNDPSFSYYTIGFRCSHLP